MERIQHDFHELKINAWYLDDGILCDSPKALHHSLEIIEEDSPARGLNLNGSKSHLFIPKDAITSCNTIPAEVPISKSGFCLLGAPIATPKFCELTTMKRVKKISSTTSKLRDLEDSQMDITLLLSCLVLPKFKFALGACPPSAIRDSIIAFDYLMRDSFSDLSGVTIVKLVMDESISPKFFKWLEYSKCPITCPCHFDQFPGSVPPTHDKGLGTLLVIIMIYSKVNSGLISGSCKANLGVCGEGRRSPMPTGSLQDD